MRISDWSSDVCSSDLSCAASCRRRPSMRTNMRSFHDINPQAPLHILVIPKGAYVSWDDFSERGSDAEIAGFVRAVGKVARDQGLVAPGYRLLANTGLDSHQEIPHQIGRAHV